jgi:methylthioribose-1-phosphate isomerase
MQVLETVRWNHGKIRILDQILLPGAEVYRDLGTVDELIEAIASLAVRGAPAIGVAGALGLALAADALARQGLRDGAAYMRMLQVESDRIAAARPTAINLRWACRRVMSRLAERAALPNGTESVVSAESAETGSALSAAGVEALRKEALAEALRILEEDLALSEVMAKHGAALLPDEGRVISHCNTGGLATAGGGTALSAVFEATRQGKRIFVHVDETRPLLQGARLTAWELGRAGIPYAVHCDGAAAWLMKTRRIDAVLVGADRVAANGDTANKVGTLSLALAARAYGVPFYVVAPFSSFDLSLASGQAIPIEERAADEVRRWGGACVTPADAPIWNPAFDVTDAALVTSWVTERGAVRPPFDLADSGSAR